MFASVYTFTHSDTLYVNVHNCFHCGGALDRSPLTVGDSATCTACGSEWTLRPVAS